MSNAIVVVSSCLALITKGRTFIFVQRACTVVVRNSQSITIGHTQAKVSCIKTGWVIALLLQRKSKCFDSYAKDDITKCIYQNGKLWPTLITEFLLLAYFFVSNVWR